jgi:pimeloyl-ACP methyl ester carboxylesterase
MMMKHSFVFAAIATVALAVSPPPSAPLPLTTPHPSTPSTFSAVQKTTDISLPVAVTVFPQDVYCPPESWARRAYRNLIYFHEAAKGGHFAAWEEPQLFTEELRTAFRTLG